MAQLTVTALLYVACFAFFHASKKRSTFEIIRNKPTLQRGTFWLGWGLVVGAAALMIVHKGPEVGIPLFIGAWVAAGVLSVFLQALWQRAHTPFALICAVVFAVGFVTVNWGGTL